MRNKNFQKKFLFFLCFTFFLNGSGNVFGRDKDSLLAVAHYFIIHHETDPALYNLKLFFSDKNLSHSDSLKGLNHLAEALINSGNYDSAWSVINSNSFRAQQDKSTRLNYYLNILACDLGYRDYEAASNTIATINQFSYPDKKGEIDARYYYLNGIFLSDQGLYEEALLSLLKAGTIYGSDSLRFAYSLYRVNNESGYAAIRLGKTKEAERFYQLALYYLEAAPFSRENETARIYNNLGNIYYRELNNYAAAKTYYETALLLKEKTRSDLRSLLVSYINTAAFYESYGNYLLADEKYSMGEELIGRVKDDFLAGSLYNNWAGLKVTIGNIGQGLNFYQRAEEYFLNSNRAENSDLFPVYLNLGRYYLRMDNLQKSRMYLDKAHNIKGFDQNTSLKNSLKLLLSYGVLYKELHLPVLADQYYDSALFLIPSGDPSYFVELAEVYDEKGVLYLQTGQQDLALKFFRNSLTVKELISASNKPQIIKALNNLGEVFLARSEFDSASHYLSLAVERNQSENTTSFVKFSILSQFYDPVELLVSYYFLSKMSFKKYLEYPSLSDLEISFQYINLANNIIQAFRTSQKDEMNDLFFSKMVKDVFELGLEVCCYLIQDRGREDYLDMAFHFSESAKLQVLINAIRTDKIKTFANVTRQLTEREKNLHEKMAAIDYQLSVNLAHDANREYMEQEYKTNYENIKVEYTQLVDSIRNSLPEYYNLRYNDYLVPIKTLQSDVLAEEDGLISYLFGSKNLFILFFTKEQGFILKAGSPDKLLTQITAYKNLIYHKFDTEFVGESEILYRQLVYPVDSFIAARNLKIHRLLLVTDEGLSYLPFETLISKNENTGKTPDFRKLNYLLNQYEISYTYSATLFWQKFQSTEKTETFSFIGFAPVYDHSSEGMLAKNTERSSLITDTAERRTYDSFYLQDLPQARSEVRKIADIFHKKNLTSHTFIGEEATENRLKTINLSGYSYIHLATHGFVDMANANYSGIVFSRNFGNEDDLLYADEIYNLHLNAELVTLSACKTGLGTIVKGEGIIGLTRGFLYAGTRNLLVSLWKVPDLSTSQLMIAFYDNLLKSNSKISSIRAAKTSLIRSVEYSHPYFWAPFILIGR